MKKDNDISKFDGVAIPHNFYYMTPFLGLVMLCTLVLARNAYADFDKDQLTYSLGMVNVSYAEAAPATKSESTDPDVAKKAQAASGSASVMALDVTYEKFLNSTRSFVFESIVPLMGGGQNAYVYGGGGFNFYYGSFSTKGEFKNAETSIQIIPKWRFYWGPNFGFGFLLYSTQFKQKSDLIVDIGLHTGLNYSINERWGFKLEGAFSRGVGLTTTSTIMKIIIGGSRFF